MGCWPSKEASSASDAPPPQEEKSALTADTEAPKASDTAPIQEQQRVVTKPQPTWKRYLQNETENLNDLYELGRVLGRGQFGTTRIAVEKSSKMEFACKSISKRKMTHPEDIEDVKREIQILHHLTGHPHICEFKGAYEDRHNIHLVMELCTGGELFDRIVKRGHYSERDAAEVMRVMLGVVAHCHDMGVIHRDLKPENFLLSDKSEKATLKAIDFGLSVYFSEGQFLKQIVGSAYYVAPEVLKKHYSKEADIWSCGVILYILLSGYPPFYGDTESQIFEAILRGKLDMESDPWPEISQAAKNCVSKMLTSDPRKRASAEQILKHDWMKENGVASDKPLSSAVLGRLKGFAAMNKLKKEALKVIAVNLPKEEIEGLKQMFIAIDTDHSGTITVDELRDGLKKKGAMIPEADLEALMNDVDIDGNGVIDYEEFVAATLNINAKKIVKDEEHLLKAFRKFDTDGNGSISRDELRQALQQESTIDQDIEKILDEVDANGDGEISYEEFKTMLLGN